MSGHASVFYCDDIRHEQGGKVSLMGIYGTHLLINSFPATLPKLCVHFNIEFPEGEEPEVLKIMLKCNSEVIHLSELSDLSFRRPIEEDNDENFRLAGGFEVSPIKFEGPSRLEFFAEYNGDSLAGPRLFVRTRKDFAERSRQE